MKKISSFVDQFIVKWLWYGKIRGYGYKIVRCPVCNHLMVNENSICPNCGWEYDTYFDDQKRSFANGNLTVEEYRTRWQTRSL